MFPDSKVAAKFACRRTKATAIARTLGQEAKAEILRKIREAPFSVSTDGSSDRGAQEQLYPIIVRYFDNEVNRVLSVLLEIATTQQRSTGQNIFQLLDDVFTKNKIPWKNVICFAADNAAVMMGSHSGVAAFVTKANPDTFIMGCPCHLLHLAAEKGASQLPFSPVDLLVPVFYYLEKSSKRNKEFKECQIMCDAEQHIMLKHVCTRWLSLERALSRLIEQWEPLKLYFSSEARSTGKKRSSDGDVSKNVKKQKVSSGDSATLQSKTSSQNPFFLVKSSTGKASLKTSVASSAPSVPASSGTIQTCKAPFSSGVTQASIKKTTPSSSGVAPAPKKTAPSSSGVAPAPKRTAPSSSGVAPAPKKTAPSSSGVAPAPKKTAPSSSGVAPAPKRTAPSSSGVAPAPKKTAPSSSGVAPAPKRTAPSSSGVAPTPKRTAPSSSGVAPAPKKTTPSSSGVVPFTAKSGVAQASKTTSKTIPSNAASKGHYKVTASPGVLFSGSKSRVDDHSAKNSEDKAGKILGRLNEYNKLYCLFLLQTLPLFNKLNLELQEEAPKIHVLQEKLQGFLQDVLIRFVKPSVIAHASSPEECNYRERCNQKEDDDIVIGAGVRSFLTSKTFTEKQKEEFFSCIRNYFVNICDYVMKKFPMKSEFIEHASVADPRHRLNARFSSVCYFVKKFHLLEDHIDQLELEFANYQVDKLESVSLDQRIDDIWMAISQIRDKISSKEKYVHLPRIMYAILSVPHSNAEDERIFSIVRKNSTEFRPSLATPTLSDFLTQKVFSSARKTCCYQMKFSENLLEKCKKAASAYNKSSET
ncbi:uncharacterized protein [Diadema antillarum]|uniref:uncharacterized protein n=1 Tax=Diadema antillarum TaxID=105358 RepID=UPI003A884C28